VHAQRHRGDLLFLGLTAAGLILFYVLLFPIKGIRVPPWSDAQAYIWWTRRASALGLRAIGTGSRPATVATLATLSAVLRLPAEAIVEAIGPVLATAVGLAAAALSDSVLGPNRTRFVVVAVLSGTFVSQLAIGFDATLAFAALFLAGLAYLSEGLGGSRRTPFVAASILLGVAALAHPVFGVMEAGLLIAGIVGLVLWHRRSRGADRGGPIRLVVVVILAAAIAALGLLVARSAPGPPLDTSADTVLRRLGLWSVLRVGWRETLVASLAILAPTAVVSALALARRGERHWASSPDRGWTFAAIGAAWLVGTAASIPMLLLGASVPAQRFVTLCLPLPVMIATGITGRPSARRPRAAAALLLVSIAGVAFLVPRYWVAWEAQRGESAPAVVASRAMGSALARQPAGTPLVLIDDDPRGLPALFTITGHAGYLRDAVPPARVADVFLFVGSVQDFLAGRPTLSGDVSRDLLATDYWNRIRPVLDRPSLVVAASPFDQVAYRDALALPGHVTLARGVVALPGFTGANGGLPPSSAAFTSPGAGPLSSWLPVWLAPLLVLVLGVIGWPWVTSTLPGRGRIGAALSPAVGLAALSLGAIATDAVGLRLQGWSGVIPVIAALGGGLAMLACAHRRGDEGAPPAPIGRRTIPASGHVTDIARTSSP
jgi:hypothetical protein